MDKISILDALQSAHDDYFKVFLEHYPLIPRGAGFAEFGSPKIFDLAIEVHSCVIALGPTVRERLFYLGLDLLYPFDNPIDYFNWSLLVKKEKIDHTTYASIAIRIDSELKRIRKIFQLKCEGAYEMVPADAFLVSKMRYKAIAASDGGEVGGNKPSSQQLVPSMHIDTVNIQYPADAQAVSKLEKLEKETTIGSNVSNIISILKSIFGG